MHRYREFEVQDAQIAYFRASVAYLKAVGSKQPGLMALKAKELIIAEFRAAFVQHGSMVGYEIAAAQLQQAVSQGSQELQTLVSQYWETVTKPPQGE